MSIRYEAFPIGIEEEYLLIDPETRALAGRQPAGFMARCKEILGSRVTHEFLQSQVEIGTGVCRTVSWVTSMPLAASISSTMRKLNGNRKYNQTAWLITSAGKRWRA